ncbi:MAG: Hsp20 family protein [Gammaproteobacteria bacterium]|nr:Hsp20 family protein [Gammaproteobacteria bacterium]
MSTYEQLRQGLQSMWDNIAEGWQHLRENASSALTRFKPLTRNDNLQTAQDIAMLQSSRWGLLVVDMEESEDDISVRMEAPGMDADDFDIAVIDEQLVIRGTKLASREHKSGQYHISECAYGAFERIIPLPAVVDESKARARYRRGVLMVTLPKTHQHKRRRIEVHHS